MEFIDILKQYDWDDVSSLIAGKTAADVQSALSKSRLSIDDFMALVSPAADPFLEQMAQRSHHATQKRFGKTVQLYIPLYLSNACHNHCVYCGYNHNVKQDRITLQPEQILEDVKIIKSYGFEHILLVTGESARVGVDYLKDAMDLISNQFSQISIEVQPLLQEEYETLIAHGLHSVYLYQETYNASRYPVYHPKGKKASFENRLDTYERLGRAHIHKMGLGVLLGLENWRTEAFFVATHLRYLQKKYWRSKYSMAFPRLRPHAGSFEPNVPVSERELLQLMCAYRIFDEDLEISLSTRESPQFRDHAFQLGVTSMSAASSTEPGGYAHPKQSLGQFNVNDDRSSAEIVQAIQSRSYEVIWKDWEAWVTA